MLYDEAVFLTVLYAAEKEIMQKQEQNKLYVKCTTYIV